MRDADPYVVLQVAPSADLEVIRASYRALARKHHPDAGGKPGRMEALNAAWEVLRDPKKRAAYDARRLAAYAGGGSRSKSTDSTAARSATQSTGPAAQPVAPVGPAARPTSPYGFRQEPGGSGTVLDFGRHAGRSIGALAREDPDYLEWLARTPIGRALRPEIDAALASRASDPREARRAPTTGRRAFGFGLR